MGIETYSSTAGNNTSVGGVSIAENCPVANLNNALRAIPADLAVWYHDSQWVQYGDGDGAFTITYASATSFTVSGTDVTSTYHAGRRVRAQGSSTGTIYGAISSSSFSTNTTVNVTWASGSLSNESLTIWIGALSKTNDSIPEGVITAAKIGTAAVTAAKVDRTAVNGQTALTAPATDDTIVLDDTSATALKTMTLSDLLKVVNGLTEDTAPDTTADFLLSYDTSASTVKKVKPKNFRPRYYAEYTTYTALSTAIPVDNTTPLSGEGTQVLSISVTTTTATQRVRARFRGFGGATSGNYITAALFRDTTCLDVSVATLNASSWGIPLSCEIEEVPGAGTYTYSVRVGPASGNGFLNGLGSGQLFNGACRSTLIIDLFEP